MSLLPVIDPPQDMGGNVDAFLRRLSGPCCIYIGGGDRSRCRFVVTLLHGNEPSGLHAIHRLLEEGVQPVCDIYIAIMNVSAALAEPVFSHRHLSKKRDLNRCFKAPFDDEDGQLAQALLHLIAQKKPEALLDIHNTSGSGPPFGVAVRLDSKHDALVSLFTERLIVTDMRIGALMELSEQDVPTVTIECGGAEDPESHCLAAEGLRRYFVKTDLFDLSAAPWPIEVLHNPVRLEFLPELTFTYGENPDSPFDLVLRPDIERFNLGVVTAETVLGWGSRSALKKLVIRCAGGVEPVDTWFNIVDGELRPVRTLKLSMITSRPAIARSDCLLYAIRCREP